MLRLGAALVAIAVVWLAWRRRAPVGRSQVGRWLLGFAALFALQRALHVAAGWPTLHAVAPGVRALAAAASLAVLWPLAHLSLQGFGAKRDRFWRLPLLALALVLWMVPGVPPGAVTTLAVLGLPGYAWCRPLGTRDRFGAAVLLLALTLLALFPRAAAPAPDGLPRALHDLAQSLRILVGVWTGAGTFRAFAAFVSDPSLGIRTIGSRLALSHVLVLLVPLLITVTLWFITTWLGVNNDRALAAARAFEAASADLARSLEQAVSAGRTDAADLRALAEARSGDWPRLRVWTLEAGSLRRVVGDSLPEEGLLREWSVAPDSVPHFGIVTVDTSLWAGAIARDTVRGRSVLALAPLTGVLAAVPSRVAGAGVTQGLQLRRRLGEFWIDEDSLPEGVGDADDLEDALRDRLRRAGEPLEGPDSTRIRRLLPFTRALGIPDSAVRAGNRNRPQGAIVIGTDAGTFEAGPEAVDPRGGNWAGHALVPSVTLLPGRVRSDPVPISVDVSAREALTGMWRASEENPTSIVPAVVVVALLALLLPVAAFNFAMVGGMGRSIALATGALRRAATAIGGGDLRHRVDVRGDDDLWDTAKQFNRMAEELERSRELEKERSRLESELEVARRIQARLLPASPPAVPGIEIAGHSESAREIGGDYYDHIPVGDERVLLVVADVSGKGVPAALLMSAFRASLMSQDASAREPGELAARLNHFLHRSVDPGKFVTAFVGFLDGGTGRFVYANAGHNPPLLLRADGEPEWLSAGGLILGILPDAPFESGSTELRAGDVLVLYTDGVTEGADASGEQWGEERLVEAVRRRRSEPARELAHGLVREVRAFEGETGPADDITVLVARRRDG